MLLPDLGTRNHTEEGMVTHAFRPAAKALSMIGIGLLLIASTHPASLAQEKHAPQTAGVDNTKMGPYRGPGSACSRGVSKGR
jgi:hypothetical protein